MKTSKKNRNIINIILAIVIAVGLWLYVINVENPTGSAHLRDLPVEIQGTEALAERDLMVTDVSREKMSLKVSGKKKTLMKLSKKNLSLAVDVSGLTGEGEWTLNCRAVFPAHVNTDNVSISDWNDLKVTVTVQKQESKEVPVRGQFIGTEAEHCLAGRVTTDPAALTLKGPAPVLEGIDYALVQVGGEDIRDTLVEQAPVVLIGRDDTPANVEHITCSETKVEVTVPVRQVVSVPLTIALKEGGGASAEDVEYSIKPAAVTLVAAEEGEELPAAISLGEIDLREVLGKTSYSLPIQLPKGVTGWNVPKFASVSLSLDTLASRQVATKNISLQNVPQGCTADLLSQQLYVWVRGDPARISELTADQITVEADLSGAVPGKNIQRIPAKVTLKDGDKTMGIVGTQYRVALRLTR